MNFRRGLTFFTSSSLKPSRFKRAWTSAGFKPCVSELCRRFCQSSRDRVGFDCIQTILIFLKLMPGGEGGYLSFIFSRVSTTRDATTKFRYHFLLAGIAYQGAKSVLVPSKVSWKTFWYFGQNFRSWRSLILNFQCFF